MAVVLFSCLSIHDFTFLYEAVKPFFRYSKGPVFLNLQKETLKSS